MNGMAAAAEGMVCKSPVVSEGGVVTRSPQGVDEALNTGLSSRTRKARSSDARCFLHWCEENGLVGHPAQPATVARFLSEMQELRATATVRRYLSTISLMHRRDGLADPTRSREVRTLLEREGGRGDGGGIQPIHRDNLEQMLASTGDHLRDLRDCAILLVAYDSMLRRSDLAALDLENLRFYGDGTARVVEKGENGMESVPHAGKKLGVMAVQRLRRWIRSAGIDGGALFRGIDKCGLVGGRLSDRGVVRALKRMAAKAGLDGERISGLSCRVGAAMDMMAQGAEIRQVMEAGGWRTPVMVVRYKKQEESAC
ncbi:MAG: tyrosine-type recombinase/integrase [Magnetococcales bacterium]|nr:tyrosine-type recombinase/integrase [Magnetococcales bacterium]